jgi:hypothetical protein
MPPPLPGHPAPNQPLAAHAPTPAGRDFSCPQCGGRLEFAPESHALKCVYCGFAEPIHPSAAHVKEQDWDAFWKSGGEVMTLPGRSSQCTCQVCGAVVLLDDRVAADTCPYCGSHLEHRQEAAKGMIPPTGVVPFAVGKDQACAAFNRWLAGRWFTPSGLRKFADLGKLAGVYVPFWTYDSMTHTQYTGERGDDYTETETYTERDASGQNVTRTRQVTKTRWTRVTGRIRHFYDDVLICACRTVEEGLIRGLEPWDLPRAEDFREEFLSGFQAERYGIGLRDGFERAKAVMDGDIRHRCVQDIGGNHQRLLTVETQYTGVRFKHLLLPAWIAAYRYQNQLYQILVNGQTGKVSGRRPYSWVKIVLLILVVVAVVAAIILLFATRASGASAGPRFGDSRQGVRPAAGRKERPATFSVPRLGSRARGESTARDRRPAPSTNHGNWLWVSGPDLWARNTNAARIALRNPGRGTAPANSRSTWRRGRLLFVPMLNRRPLSWLSR